MIKWTSYNPSTPIAVIPTCTDMDLFSLTVKSKKGIVSQNLGISNKVLVISYLGSVEHGICWMKC